jgi:flagellar hook-length control protein FliK
MDAVSLALPVNKAVGPAVAAGDNGALTDESGQGPVDFASLLAAGLGLQELLLDPAKVAASEMASPIEGQAGPAIDPASAATDPLATLIDPTALPIPPQIQERPAQGELPGARNADADQRLSAALFARQDADSTKTAAETARFAALNSQDAKDAATTTPTLQLDFAEEMRAIVDVSDAQRTDAAEAATQALNLHATEQRPSTQQPVAVREVGAPVGSAGFANELSRQVVWMVDKDAQIAELRINPPDLGPIEVRLSVSGDQASAKFVSAHAEVREALETSIARLRESFAEAGIQLGEASVSAESFRDQTPPQAEARSQRDRYADAPDAGGAPAVSLSPPRVHRGLVDTFA